MELHMRSVPEVAEEATLAEQAPSFEEFYGANFRHLFTALCLVTGNRHEAEEITQDSFLRVYERWDRVGALDDLDASCFFLRRSTRRGTGHGSKVSRLSVEREGRQSAVTRLSCKRFLLTRAPQEQTMVRGTV